MGLITTVSPYRGSLSPQPIYYPTPQHTYQHTYKLAYHNSITSFSISNLFNYRNYHAHTALHELDDDHVFLTSARCKWHSNSNSFNLCLRGGLGWWFGSLGIDDFVNLEKNKNIKPCKQ